MQEIENSPIIEEPEQITDIEENSLIQNPQQPRINHLKTELSKVNKILIVSVMVVILALILCFILLSLFPKPYSKIFIGLEKPTYDERKYKAITLPNQMKVLLISDQKSELGGVSIDVGVGSWNEPANLHGLAHFLEHMVFMGSKKYPNVNEFNDFISQNGGTYNAQTGSQNTNFFFTVSSSALENATDIFSRFFIDPSLDKETVSKEINAVNSEYTNDLTDPNWRIDIAFEMIANKGHPSSRFTIGNLKTLRDDPKKKNLDTYVELEKFHSQTYSSNLMSAVILSKDSLEDLEMLARSKFSDIPNKNIDRNVLNTFQEPAFDEHNKGIRLSYKSAKEEKTMDIAFSIDSKLDDFKKKPLAYLSNLIDNENPNGFSVFLKEKGYITELDTFMQSQNTGYSLFVIHLELTDKGYEEVDDVVKNVFGYLRKIENEGISVDRFEEFKKIYAFRFLYKEKKNDLMEELRDYSFVLGKYPTENVLNANYIIDSYDQDLYKSIISSFVPNKSIILLGNKEFFYKNDSNSYNESSDSFLHDKLLKNYSDIYKFYFDIQKIPDQLLVKFSEYNETNFQQILLPKKNRYLPETLFQNSDQIFKDSALTNGILRSSNNNKKSEEITRNSIEMFDTTPILAVENDKFFIWHKTDDSFKLPMYVILVSLDSPITHLSAENNLMISILIEHLNQETAKYLYDAINIGYKIEFDNNGKGLEILIKGYSDKNDMALLEVMKLIKNVKLDQNKFNFLQKIVSKNLKNDYTEAAYKHGKDLLKKILRKYFYTPNDLEKFADTITLDGFNQFLNDFKSKLFVEILVYGNVQQKITENLAQNLSSLIDFEVVNKEDLMKEQILNIRDHIHEFRDFSENIEDENNLLLNYYQYGPYQLNTSVLLAIINQKFSNDAFNYLRGELQLGYFVNSYKLNWFGINGLALFIQGSVADPIMMDERAEEFLEIFTNTMESLSDEEFESTRKSNIKILQEEEKEIEARSKFVWDEIRNQFYEFDKKSKALEVLKNLKKSDLIQFYTDFVHNNIGKLSIQLYSKLGGLSLLNKTEKRRKSFIRVNGTSDIIVKDSSEFNKATRYPFQSIPKNFKNYEVSS